VGTHAMIQASGRQRPWPGGVARQDGPKHQL